MLHAVRNIVVSFLAGWILWFWVDKDQEQYRSVMRYPRGESLIQDLQLTMNLIKAGALGPAFVYIWYAHYVLLAVFVGILVSFALPSLARLLGALRWPRRR